MSSKPSGECCVCGKPTSQRCSACSAVGVDLFFCGGEHQKLVWFAHKRVCGSGKAKPFHFPPLSQKEAAMAVDMLEQTVEVMLMERETSIAKEMRALLNPPTDTSLGNLKAILVGLAKPPPQLDAIAAAGRACMLCTVRRMLYEHVEHGHPKTPTQRDASILNAEHPNLALGHFAAVLAEYLFRQSGAPQLRVMSAFAIDQNWYIRLMHHAVIVAALQWLSLHNNLTSVVVEIPSRYQYLVVSALKPISKLREELKRESELLDPAVANALFVLTIPTGGVIKLHILEGE
ncbi:hypothetical protein JCM10213_008195 [Rhodosporidiobolus nylandii]